MIIILTISAIITFAQTPEWIEYCRMRKILQKDNPSADTAYAMYCKMDSIYNGIPIFSDVFDFLTVALNNNEQAKVKELAFRLVRWKCWDNNFFNKPELVSLKETDYWPKLDSLSHIYGDKSKYLEYQRALYLMQYSDQQCRRPLHEQHTKVEIDSIWKNINYTDSSNLAQLNELISLYGFPTWEKVGEVYAFYAWLIAQHSGSDYIHVFVEQLKTAVSDDNGRRKDLAYMIDRDLMGRDLPQLYGTQSIGVYVDDVHNEPRLWPVEDIEHLNDRREHMLLEPLDTTEIKIYDPKELQPY